MIRCIPPEAIRPPQMGRIIAVCGECLRKKVSTGSRASDTGRRFSSLKTEYAGCRCRYDMPSALFSSITWVRKDIGGRQRGLERPRPCASLTRHTNRRAFERGLDGFEDLRAGVNRILSHGGLLHERRRHQTFLGSARSFLNRSSAKPSLGNVNRRFRVGQKGRRSTRRSAATKRHETSDNAWRMNKASSKRF